MRKMRLSAAAIVACALLVPARAAYAIRYVEGSLAYTWEIPASVHATLSASDDAYAEVALPFDFPFFDERFTKIRIHTNGFVQFAASAQSPATPDLACGGCWYAWPIADDGTAAAPDYIVAAWWADWNPSAGGTIRYGISPTDPETFIVAWDGVVPYGGNHAYSFQVRIHKDGDIVVAYKNAVVGGQYDAGAVGSVGIQPRAGAKFGFGLPRVGVALNLTNNDSRSFVPTSASEQLYNSDPDVPDIVERYAPEWYVDWAPNWHPVVGVAPDSRCNTAITRVDFDGDWNGANVLNSLWAYATPANVYYSLVETSTHYIIGYYIYHAYDCTSPDYFCYNEHEHDFAGVHIAVNKTTREIDAMLTNAHGDRVPYKSLSPDIGIQQQSPWGSTSKHFTTVSRWLPFYHERPAVGIENDSHAVWGRFDDRCIIGSHGSESGCNDSHGGDGYVLTYDIYNQGAQEPPVNGHQQYPQWATYRYKLQSIDQLFQLAQDPAQCGDNDELYACAAVSSPVYHNTFNGDTCDSGNLPWIWAELNSGLVHTCQTSPATGLRLPNLFSDPARIFDEWFSWPSGRFFDVPPLPGCYPNNAYASIETTCPHPSFIGRCP